MCGIFFYNGSITNLQNILFISNNIKPRGPEHTSIISGNKHVHCFHRLAINNISDECNQPFIYNDNDEFIYTVMCNGEIYNWKNIAESFNLDIKNHNNDCGVIFPLFKQLDYNFNNLCSLLDGEFAILITKRSKITDEVVEIWLGTDVCSIRPLFYTFDKENDIIAVSSLLSGISDLKLTSEIRRANGSETYHFINLNKFILQIESYDNLYKMTEEEIIRLDSIETLYTDYLDTIVDTFEQAVHKRIRNDNVSRPIGCLLSGGLDSSLVAAVAAKHLKLRGEILNTFSIGMKGATDLKYAKQVASFIGSNHTEIIFTEKEGIQAIDEVIKVTETYDITTIRASIGQYLLSKWISKNTNIKIILNGDGADECEMGYLYFYNAPNSIEAQKDSLRLVKEIHYFDGLRVDRNISYHGLEARVPFLDKDFVKLFLNKIPPKFKVPSFECEKFLIRKAFERFNILPSEVLWRRKEAFSDGISPLTKSWFEILTDYFNSQSIPITLENTINTPYTKESTYYRLRFIELFGSTGEKTIPHFWLPSWSNEKDPSARKLKNIYNK